VHWAFSGVATTGGIANAAYASGSCSATYCHGNFSGGANAAPSWTAGAMTCTSCHGSPPSTGEHGRSQHRTAGCGACHSSYTATAVNVGLHVNGGKDVGGTGTFINTWNATTLQCAPVCHGTESW
jgi:predicted CxxxxCH...CXXCH cytochrome family protein